VAKEVIRRFRLARGQRGISGLQFFSCEVQRPLSGGRRNAFGFQRS
jgi:hypothetical protein